MASIEDYDVVLDVSGLQQFAEAGWPVYAHRSIDPKVNKILENNLDFSGKVVSVLGLYDKGKSFLVNKLFHLNLGSGKRVHTRGVSMRLTTSTPPTSNPEDEKKDILVLDTAGVHSPGKMFDTLGIVDKKGTEMFIQDLVFHLTDFIVVVVNDLTWPDQEYLLALNNRLKKSEKPTNYFGVVVLHNFKDTETEEEFLSLWKDQVINCYYGELSTVSFGVSVRDEGTLSRAAPKDHDVFYFTSRNPQSHREEMRHVAIAKENSPAGRRYNRLSFELIRRWLDEKTAQRHKVMEEIEAFSNSTMKTYFGTDVVVELPRLKIDQQDLPKNPDPTPASRSIFSRASKPNDAPETRVVVASMLAPRQKGLCLKQKVGFSVSGLGIFITSAVESDFAAVYDIYDRGGGRRLIRMELPGLIKGKDFKVVPDFALNKLVIEGEKKKWEEGDEPPPTSTPTPDYTTNPIPSSSSSSSSSSSAPKTESEETKTEEGEGSKPAEGEENDSTPAPAPTPAPVVSEPIRKLHDVTVDSYGRKYGRFRAVIDLLEELPGGGHLVYRRDGDIKFENGMLYIPLRAEKPKEEEW